jgi:hypothetical protein
MGTRGPISKGYRIGHSHGKRDTENQPQLVLLDPRCVGVPYEADDTWLPEVQRLWTGLGESPVSGLYQETDWDFAWITCVVLDHALTHKHPVTGQYNGALLTAISSCLARLLVTEGDRRKLGITIQEAS